VEVPQHILVIDLVNLIPHLFELKLGITGLLFFFLLLVIAEFGALEGNFLEPRFFVHI